MWTGPVRCVFYMAAWGLACFPLGRGFKALRLNWDRAPFAEWPWEQSGRFYERLGIRRWKDLVPDVSRMFPGIVPKKAFSVRPGAALLRDMLSETCVAELTHAVLCVAGLAMPWLWAGIGGVAVTLVYIGLGNLPFMMIQRYNRPRFRRMLTAAEARERRQMDARTDPLEQ